MYCEAYASLFMRKPRSPRPTILHQHRIGRQICRTLVGYLEVPQPDALPRMQPQREAVMHATCIAVPHEAIICSAESDLRARSQHLCDVGRWSTAAQIDACNAAADRRAKHLVEHCAAAGSLCSMAKMQPFGSALIERPAEFSRRRRPRSPSRGVVEVRAPVRVMRGSSSSLRAVAIFSALSCGPSALERN